MFFALLHAFKYTVVFSINAADCLLHKELYMNLILINLMQCIYADYKRDYKGMIGSSSKSVYTNQLPLKCLMIFA